MNAKRPIGLPTFVSLCWLCWLALSCAARGSEPAIVEHIPSETGFAPGDSLRVATLNMWGVVVPHLEIEVSDDIDERFEALAVRLSENRPQLDVVFLQEAWGSRARRRLLEHPGVARNFPYRVDAVRSPGGSGLVTLSRFPLDTETSFLRFEEQGCCAKILEGDCIGGKGVLALRAKLGRYDVWLANTHLIACYTSEGENERDCDEGDSNGEVRRSQTREAVAHMAALPGGLPAVFAGDFNFTRTSVQYPQMPAAGWLDHREHRPDPDRIDYLWSRAAAGLRWQALGPVERIFEEPVRTEAGDEVELSDHPALAVTLCLVVDGEARLAAEGAAGCLPLE